MLYHDMTNDYRNRNYRITVKLQEGYYTGELYYDYTWGGAMGHGIPIDIINRIYEELTTLNYREDEDWDWEDDYQDNYTGGFEYPNNCGFIIDKDNFHIQFFLKNQKGDKLIKRISKYDLKLYIVGFELTSCIGCGVKRDSRKCVLCKHFNRVSGTASGICAFKKRKVSQGTTICKYGFEESNNQ